MPTKYRLSSPTRTCRHVRYPRGCMPSIDKCERRAIFASAYCSRHATKEEKLRALNGEGGADAGR